MAVSDLDLRDLIPAPHLNAHFRLQIDGLDLVDFSECSGLSAEVGVQDYVEGGENRFSHRFPTRGSFPNLVLKRGTTANSDLWEWYFEFSRDGRVTPRDGQVHLLAWEGAASVPVRVWAFTRGFPVKMTGPDLNAQSPAVAIEALEIVHHGLQLVPLGV